MTSSPHVIPSPWKCTACAIDQQAIRAGRYTERTGKPWTRICEQVNPHRSGFETINGQRVLIMTGR